jgi:hypothetical protein
MGQRAWVVYRNNREIDIVYFDEHMTAEEVRKSLIEHDGYTPDIQVFKD